LENNWEELDALMQNDPAARALSMGMTVEEMCGVARLREMNPFSSPRYTQGDQGNGFLFADFYHHCLRYVKGRGCWFLYRDGAWEEDAGGLGAMEKAMELARLMNLLADEMIEPNARTAAQKRALRLFGVRVRENMLHDARSLCAIPMEAFDADPLLFNCLNGTLDLRDFSFYEHRASDLITHKAGVRYDPSAACARWNRFIAEIMARPEETQLHMDGQPDPAQDKARYLQKALGYALTGSTREECFFILYGKTTRNGKGTLVETMLRMLGTYGRTALPETIADRSASASAPNEDVARLRGSRFVSMSEPPRSMRFADAAIKRMTGSDTQTARFLHQNSFEFLPQFKIFINANYLPTIADATLFHSGRVRVIPFERHFAPHEQDKGLKAYLTRPDCLSGILNWCLEGLRLYRAEGLGEPEDVAQAIARYQADSDVLGRFMEECLVEEENAKTRLMVVYQRYRTWCAENGLTSESSIMFRRMMEGRVMIVKARPSKNEGATKLVMGYRCLSKDSCV